MILRALFCAALALIAVATPAAAQPMPTVQTPPPDALPPIHLMSGYTDDVIAQRGGLEPGIRLLEKPFSVAALLESVRRALDGGKHEGVRP